MLRKFIRNNRDNMTIITHRLDDETALRNSNYETRKRGWFPDYDEKMH